MFKLPKDVMTDERHEALEAFLAANAHPLWDKGSHNAIDCSLTATLQTVLRQAFAFGQAVQGLEAIADALAREQKGLDLLKTKAPEQEQRGRISRVLFVADDGSTRFYRDCEGLLSRYAERLLVCRLGVTGDFFGEAVFGASKLLRALLITEKKAAAKALLALVG